MRVLIIGCGYVGTAAGLALVGHGHEVFGLRRTAASELAAAGIRPLLADITRMEELAKLPTPFDWIINTASAGGGGLEAYRHIYFEGTRNILHWLQSAPPSKYVYTSSTGVYAQDDGSWVDETSPTEPTAPTAQVLLETEQLLLQAWSTQGFPAIILRVAGIYGPSRTHRPKGPDERFMNMIHRDDVTGVILAALERGRLGQIYNAVDDEPVTQKIFSEWISAKTGTPMPNSAEPGVLRKRGPANKQISNEKLKRELGYRFKHPSFREGYASEIAALQQLGLPR